MSIPELNPDGSNLSSSVKSASMHPEITDVVVSHSETKRTVGALSFRLSPKVSKEIQIIFEQTVTTTIFILGDMLIVWLAGLAFADTIRDISFVGYLYSGIKVASALMITIRYSLNCLIELSKNKKELSSEIKEFQTSEEV